MTPEQQNLELLTVPRAKVMEAAKYAFDKYKINGSDYWTGQADILLDLFSDKCYPDSDLEPYTEPQQTNDNMEEKELSIAKLLRKYNADKIYLVDEGEVELVEIIDKFTVSAKIGNRMIDLRDETLEIKPNGFAYIYPSKEAFLAHPLDAKKAWEEFAESRKPTDFLVSWRREDEKLHGSDGFARISLPDTETEKLIDSIKNVIESFRKNYEQHPQV